MEKEKQKEQFAIKRIRNTKHETLLRFSKGEITEKNFINRIKDLEKLEKEYMGREAWNKKYGVNYTNV